MQNIPNLPAIGTAIQGGFFGGVIKVNGEHTGVIWSPKAHGQIIVPLINSRKVVEGAESPFDSESNTKALLAAGSDAAQQVTEMEINGFSDWLIPARDVLELGYRHFKPTTEENYCSWRDGENANSVPQGWLYTEQSPAQTSLDAFKVGGEEAFDDAWYFSSTVLPSGRAAFVQRFLSGSQDLYYLHYSHRVRAVRLIQLSSLVL